MPPRSSPIERREKVDLRVVCPDSATLPQGLIADGPQVLLA